MAKINDDAIITEISEFEPSRVDGVGKGANGFPILMLKGIDAKGTIEKDQARDDHGRFASGGGADPTSTSRNELAQMGHEALSAYHDAVGTDHADRAENSRTLSEGEAHNAAAEAHLMAAEAHAQNDPSADDYTKEAFNASDNAERVSASTDRASSPMRPNIEKAEGDRKDCSTCDGSGKIMDGNRDCPDCKGFGKSPKVGETAKQYFEAMKESGVAPSTAPAELTESDCPTCKGSGTIRDNTHDGKMCPDCGGTGIDQTMTNVAELNAVDSFQGRISDGDPMGRERIDKSDGCPGCAAAMENGDKECATCGAKVEADATKADGTYTAPNAALGVVVTPIPTESDVDLPGSPAWEAVDAAMATSAVQALMSAAELIRKFSQRESIEVAAGEGNDIFDTMASESALVGVSQALGVMAQLAFHESQEAQKGIEESVEKAGRRISGKTIQALATARDHLSEVLGKDDPSIKEEDGDSATDKYIANANKASLSKEIEDMSTDELEKVLNERDERLVELLADAMKGTADSDQAESVDTAEAAKDIQKEKKHKKDDEEESEMDETDKSDDEMSEEDDKATKAELTEEEIEAKLARKEAKKALRAAERAEKDAAENAAVQKAIAEGVAEATAAVLALQDRLSTVEKMAAPSTIVRTRPQDALNKSVEKDELDMRIAQLERVARETPDQDIRKAAREEAKELRDQIAALSA